MWNHLNGMGANIKYHRQIFKEGIPINSQFNILNLVIETGEKGQVIYVETGGIVYSQDGFCRRNLRKIMEWN